MLVRGVLQPASRASDDRSAINESSEWTGHARCGSVHRERDDHVRRDDEGVRDIQRKFQ